MKKFETILFGLVVIGVLITMFAPHFAGKHIFTVLFTALLSLLYFGFGFLVFNGIGLRQLFKGGAFRGISALRMIGSVALGMSLSVLINGILFRLMHWPGSGVLLLVGFSCAFLAGIVSAVNYFSSKEKFYQRILVRCGFFATVGLVLMAVSPMAWVRFNYPGDARIRSAYQKTFEHPEDERAQRELRIAKGVSENQAQ